MKIYQASLSERILRRYFEIFNERLNVLLSIAQLNSDTQGFMGESRHMIDSIILDSGAFSVVNGKSNVTLESLISYLQLWGDKFDYYFNFDNDFSENSFGHNHENLILMERAGLNSAPVLHNFYNEEIGFYAGSGRYPYLALGSKQAKKFKDMKHAVTQIKELNPDTKIHWFGGSKYETLIKLPIASCDTSSWAQTGSFGYLNYWNPEKTGLNKADQIYVGGYEKDLKFNKHFMTYPWKNELETYLRNTFGLRYKDIIKSDMAYKLQLINTRFYAELERMVNEERVRSGVALE